ncbi:SDR family oxidoreductase [Enemella evansiae]|uniref:SDR family oxidoreductase n=1 Tax=Enemella evansiae TaxID=2016499 RepID=UPI000B971FD5|nr:SDR family oxidoreductase [Enemella evansiae]OYN96993.1 2-deoxy-D-gluconate 3-dehydrogenase [Enemella evansiae]OYO06165.1 2-deoxy-D-gluconate 3-dehydrogenase [Enemella evansiae]OYO13735.1 2-deoxy-D-gluconate 3-dehydrogenase [Enemella evansiae]OYO17043.1 2-deoxy-D-gluconate 3-dehydrogenase [Enemella evansiae]
MSILDLFSLSGKTAAVTGASRGIGEAIAVALVEAGADVVGVATGAEPPKALAEAAEKHGRTLTWRQADLSDKVSVAELAADLGSVDILVNNAGIIRRTPAAEHSDQDWADVLQINLDAPWVLARQVGRSMLERGAGGKIIFTASLLSFQGGINVPGYTAAKSAIAGLTRALANEWAGQGINVNAIAPGYIATDNTQALRDDEKRSAELMARIPAGRWGKPEDIAAAAVYLASPGADYVHGSIITVDGGWMAR